ncbi:MAG TPA: hypothetical protein VFY39_13330 [Gammaproteobacteria bacterium]|nr:hypothetical protein [Gammaproteobacteria bacterium]
MAFALALWCPLAQAGASSASPAGGDTGARTAESRLPWMYELEAGYLHPSLEQYSTFYGSGRSGFFSLSAAYRFRSWLEAGAEIGRMRDHGAGRVVGGSGLGGSVTYTLTPLQVFASFMLERPGSRWVPYLSLGAAAIFYDENIDLQPDRSGRSRFGGAEKAGVRWRFASKGGAEATLPADTPWRGYVFLEAQHISGESAGFDLGGTAYMLGVRIEFRLAGR